MAAIIQPLATTVRVIEWEELPEKVRCIPDNFDPLADGVLMGHQKEWVKLKAQLKLSRKGRRTGITFAEALDKTLVASASIIAGGRSVYYVGDTKDKGLEFVGYCAKFARVIAEAQGQGVSGIEEFIFEDQDEKGNSKNITSYRIRFSSGYQVVALSSRPSNIRGLQGDVVIDEAAYHQDVQAVIDAASALRIWGGNITIISTHNGIDNAFNTLGNDIIAGYYGKNALVHTVTFDDAVANGLYERVCLMNRWTPSAEAKEEWYTDIRKGYGTRLATMREELDCIPQEGSGVALPSTWIERAMREARPVLRLTLDDDFLKKTPNECKSYIDDWIKQHLAPLIAKLNPKQRHILAQDYARHRDFSVIGIGAITETLKLYVPFIIELHNVPYNEQKQLVCYILDNLPRFVSASFDATGNGETLAENIARKYSSTRVHQIKLNRAWYGTWTQQLINLFSDDFIDLPRDENIEQDLRQIVTIDGVKMVPDLRLKDLKEPHLIRHGDSAVMLILLRHAMANIKAQPMEATLVARRHGGSTNPSLNDIPDNSRFGGNW